MQDVDITVRAIAGMRRIDRVRIVEGDRLHFYVEGVGHRLPVRREVNAAVARALMRDVPCLHEYRRDAGATRNVRSG